MTGDDDAHGHLVGQSAARLEGELPGEGRFSSFSPGLPTISVMRRYSCHRRLGVVGAIAAVLAVSLSAAAPHPASADTLLQHKQKQLAHVRAQVNKLDLRSEQVTEQYDKAVWQLSMLHGEIIKNTNALHAAEKKLAAEQKSLAGLLVTQYKGGNTQEMAIVLGARSLSQVANGIDYKRRTDQAISEAVVAIQADRDAIAVEQTQLYRERKDTRKQKAQLAFRRVQIQRMLKKRHALLTELGTEVSVIKGADSIGQGKLALAARSWIMADQKANRADPGAELRDTVVLEGLKQMGVPYVWGGASPQGFDCSGLVMWLWAHHGVSLPHFAAAQYALGPVVEEGPTLDIDKLQIGDLLFFHDLGHVGIYAGNGLLLHAPHTGDVVRLESLSDPWFTSTFVGATRPGPA